MLGEKGIIEVPQLKNIPREVSANNADVGLSLAFPREFSHTVSNFHKKGCFASKEYLARHFSITLLPHYALHLSGILIGKADSQKSFLHERFEQEVARDPENVKIRILGRNYLYLQSLRNFLPPKELAKLSRAMRQNSIRDSIDPDNTMPLLNAYFAQYAPVLETMKDCQLLHQLGAELMWLRTVTENRDDNPGRTILLQAYGHDDAEIIQASIEAIGTKLQQIIYSMISYYIDEAKAYCATNVGFNAQFGLSEYADQVLNNADPMQHRCLSVQSKQNIIRALLQCESSGEHELELTKQEEDSLIRLMDTGIKSSFLTGGHTQEKLSALDASSVCHNFSLNSLTLPTDILDAIDELYPHGLESIPSINTDEIKQKDNQQERQFDRKVELETEQIIARLSPPAMMYDMYPQLNALWAFPERASEHIISQAAQTPTQNLKQVRQCDMQTPSLTFFSQETLKSSVDDEFTLAEQLQVLTKELIEKVLIDVSLEDSALDRREQLLASKAKIDAFNLSESPHLSNELMEAIYHWKCNF